ncbi:Eukaryotic translation initiation factor 4B1 [Hirschfeldia incana]|nr:Eukaryotic translation initiation factor 4B1 [Hirschfeldia incana]
MSKPWGGIGIGAWADEAEKADEEQAAEASATAADVQSFPSLKEAASNVKSKKKKKMSLSEFGAYAAPAAGRNSVGLTQQEILQLPTGPRQRSEDEMQQGRLGGGFSSYGGRSGGGMGRDRNDSEGSWGGGGGGGRRGYGGGFDEDRRGGSPRVSEFPQSSRADEVDDWGKGKKSIPFDQGRGGGRYGGLGGGGSFNGGGGGGGSFGGGGFSKADETDNWAAGKRQAPVRSSTFGSGYGGDAGREPDRWSRGVAVGGVQEERRRLVLEPRKVELGGASETTPPAGAAKTSKPSPFGAARPREEVLAEKGLDWKKLDSEIDAKKGSSRPTSAQSSRPSSAQSNRSESSGLNNVVKPRPKVNPFGDAKPREVLLEEQGKDWRKMDMELEHRRVDRPETEEEKMLKEEIEELRKKLEKESIAPEVKQEPGTNNNNHDLPETLRGKEKDLEILTRELDDKVRFRQKPVERPGSGAGRTGSYSERTHSRSGSVDESRSFESTERPRSRGAVDAWVRPVDDQRRNFQGSKERGFFSNRPSSREGW